jgi:hypothetical protein
MDCVEHEGKEHHHLDAGICWLHGRQAAYQVKCVAVHMKPATCSESQRQSSSSVYWHRPSSTSEPEADSVLDGERTQASLSPATAGTHRYNTLGMQIIEWCCANSAVLQAHLYLPSVQPELCPSRVCSGAGGPAGPGQPHPRVLLPGSLPPSPHTWGRYNMYVQRGGCDE